MFIYEILLVILRKSFESATPVLGLKIDNDFTGKYVFCTFFEEGSFCDVFQVKWIKIERCPYADNTWLIIANTRYLMKVC